MPHHSPDECKDRIALTVVGATDDDTDIIGLNLFSWVMCNLSDHVRWCHVVPAHIELFEQYLSLSGFVLMADMLTGSLESRDEYQP